MGIWEKGGKEMCTKGIKEGKKRSRDEDTKCIIPHRIPAFFPTN
jgi:hypothetical protein